MRHRRYSGFVLEGWRNPAATTILTDRSRFKNNGAFTGATWAQLPTGAWVMDFTNAANLVTIPANASINDMPEFTWCGWVKIVGAGGANFGRMFDKGVIYITVDYANKRILVSVAFSGSAATWVMSNNSFTVGVWRYFEISYNRGLTTTNPIIFTNGILATISRGVEPVGIFSSDLASNYILGNRADALRSLNGYLSAPRIYNYLRTEAQALAAFNAERYLYGV